MGKGLQFSNAFVLLFKFLAYAFPILGAWIGDARTGRYKAVAIGVIICGVAHVVMIGGAAPSVLQKGSGAAPFIISLLLLAFGAGMSVVPHTGYERLNLEQVSSSPAYYLSFWISTRISESIQKLLNPAKRSSSIPRLPSNAFRSSSMHSSMLAHSSPSQQLTQRNALDTGWPSYFRALYTFSYQLCCF